MDIYSFFADYHTHTINSPNIFSIDHYHGYGSIKENALVAAFRGFSEIGITDHGYKHFPYGIKAGAENFKRIRNEIDELNKYFESYNLKILFGLESNIIDFEGNIDIKDYMFNYIDYLNVGFHKGGGQISYDIFKYDITSKNKHKFIESTIKAFENYDIKILTHPTEVIKFNREEIREIGYSAKLNNVALEINSNHTPMTSNLIKELDKIGVNFSVGSDAHIPEQIGDFTKALNVIRKSNLNPASIINCNKINTHNSIRKSTEKHICFVGGKDILYLEADGNIIFKPLDNLKEYIESKNAKIIIISSLRKKNNGKYEIENHLKKYNLEERLLGYTVNKHNLSRDEKIESWKKHLGLEYSYEVYKK